jgi:outer membrane protein TolC
LQRQLQINKDNIERLEGIKKIAKVRYANNAAAYEDYLNAQVEQSSAENDQFAIQRQIDTVRQTINTLIGREPLTPLEVKGELPGANLPKTAIEEIENIAIENNPAVKASTMQVKSAKKGLDLARESFLPDFQVQGSNQSNNPPFGLSGNSYGLELDLLLPSWFLVKEKAGMDQAKANVEGTQAGDSLNRLQVRLAVDSAYNSLSTAVKQSDFIRSRQLEQAKLAYQLGLTNYSNSSMNFTDLLTAQGNLHQTELALAQSELNAAQAYINLDAVGGKEIE